MEAHNDWIIVKTAKSFRQVETAQISHILCEDYLCTIHLISKESMICSKSLRYFEQILLPYPFVRIHHNAMVCLDKVKEVRCHGRHRHAIMNDGTALAISVRRWPSFREAMRTHAHAISNIL